MGIGVAELSNGQISVKHRGDFKADHIVISTDLLVSDSLEWRPADKEIL
jgi:hypothetical protein